MSESPSVDRARRAAARLRAQVGDELVTHDTDWTDEDPDLPGDRPCHLCGRNPAEGFASVWTRGDGERWFCHGDEQELSCYEAQSIDPTDLAWATRTIFDLRSNVRDGGE